MFGNVSEWCRDWYSGEKWKYSVAASTGEALPTFSLERVQRGGSFNDDAKSASPVARSSRDPRLFDPTLGVRPSRPLER
jgi:formylglycine-generating enzyme required for sulfatase activity